MAGFLLVVTWLSWVVRLRIGDSSVRDVKYDHVNVPLITRFRYEFLLVSIIRIHETLHYESQCLPSGRWQVTRMEWRGTATWGTMSSPPSLTITTLVTMGDITGDTATMTGRCPMTGNRNTWVSIIQLVKLSVQCHHRYLAMSQRICFPDETIWVHLRLFYPSSHVNQSMSWCNDGFLPDQGLRPTRAAIWWQIVDQSRVTGEGSEREMGFINSEPSLQEFMPHQLDSADNTPPPTGIISKKIKRMVLDNLHTLEGLIWSGASLVYLCLIPIVYFAGYGGHGPMDGMGGTGMSPLAMMSMHEQYPWMKEKKSSRKQMGQGNSLIKLLFRITFTHSSTINKLKIN